MFDATSQSERGAIAASPPPCVVPAPQRTHGVARIRFHCSAGLTRPDVLYQEGACRVRLPRVHGCPPEAVLINTAGGLTGGDTIDVATELAPPARATLTSQACEKIYRSAGGAATIKTSITLEAGASLDWLPQPTILFDRSRLVRRAVVSLASDARLLAVEGIILGRASMGEIVAEGMLHDSWRVRRGGRLVFADALTADGAIADMTRGAATLAGARAIATIILVAPDAESRIEAGRACLKQCTGGGVSAWNGMLVARLIAGDGEALIADITRVVTTLRGSPMPRTWSC